MVATIARRAAVAIIRRMETPSPANDLPPPRPGLLRGLLRGLVERILRLSYTAMAPATPGRLRLASALVLVYFVVPFDLVSDLLPLLGFGDDAIAIGLLAWRLSRHTTPDIRLRARARALRLVP